MENHVERIFIEAPKPYPLLTFKKKAFLKKNKNSMIDFNYIERTGVAKVFIETLKLINPSKIVFFIIDERELKKRYITLKQVDVMGGLYGKI
jgi:hypothetical protein